MVQHPMQAMVTIETIETIDLEVTIINPEEETIETGSNLDDMMEGEAATMVAEADTRTLAREMIGIRAGKSMVTTTREEATTKINGKTRGGGHRAGITQRRMGVEEIMIQVMEDKGSNAQMGESITGVGGTIVIVLRETAMNLDVEITQARDK
mmetsp:Transcript_12603/g.23244  ORF Transcript_12603/g.23244 Transcript_12603/m.23244 type:complete len:153 (-) Transcript_12603:4-462(-)